MQILLLGEYNFSINGKIIHGAMLAREVMGYTLH